MENAIVSFVRNLGNYLFSMDFKNSLISLLYSLSASSLGAKSPTREVFSLESTKEALSMK
ncbi:hypothetical protein FDC79_12600 [Clostridium botulinum]|nr:hypothetical protein [Clostridium botulinum]